MSAVLRKLRYLERRRRGLRCLTIEADEIELVECLIEHELLTPAAADDWEAVEHAVERLVETWLGTSAGTRSDTPETDTLG